MVFGFFRQLTVVYFLSMLQLNYFGRNRKKKLNLLLSKIVPKENCRDIWKILTIGVIEDGL